MNAAADFAAAAALLTRPLPAYVAYTDHASGGWGPLRGSKTDKIVVRTADGRVISGRPQSVVINNGSWREQDLLTSPLFRPSCYAPTSAEAATFDGKPVERIGLRGHCKSDSDDADFSTLYVDPANHTPLAVVGIDEDKNVTARIEEHFAPYGGYVLPAAIHVTVKGNGWMSWLDVLAQVDFSDYRFSSKPF